MTKEQFIDLAITYCDTFQTGNYKLGNKLYDKTHKLVKETQHDEIFMESVIHTCINHEDFRVQYLASIWALLARKFIDDALKGLDDLSKREDTGIVGFNAKMTIKVWNEEGYLKL